MFTLEELKLIELDQRDALDNVYTRNDVHTMPEDVMNSPPEDFEMERSTVVKRKIIINKIILAEKERHYVIQD